MESKKNREKNRWLSSLLEFCKIRTWMVSILLLAMYILFEKFVVFRINLSRPLEIVSQFIEGWDGVNNSTFVLSVSIVMLQFVAAYYGPIVGSIVGIAGALLSCNFVLHEVWTPGYIVCVVLSQIICGAVLYKKEHTFSRILMVNLLSVMYVNILYEIFVRVMFNAENVWAGFAREVAKQMLLLPVLCVLLYMLIATVEGIRAHANHMTEKVSKNIFTNLIASFVDSAKELKNINTLVTCSLMLALGTILGILFSFKLDDSHVVGVSVIAPQLVSALYGPVVGGVVGAVGDVLDWLISPKGAFFPGYTLNAMLGQVIYGMVLYKKKLTLPRILVSKILVALLVNLPLGTLWSWMFMEKAYIVILGSKVIQQAIQVPVLGILFYMFVSALKKTKVFSQLK